MKNLVTPIDVPLCYQARSVVLLHLLLTASYQIAILAPSLARGGSRSTKDMRMLFMAYVSVIFLSVALRD